MMCHLAGIGKLIDLMISRVSHDQPAPATQALQVATRLSQSESIATLKT